MNTRLSGSHLYSQYFGRPRSRPRITRSGVQDQPDQHGETLSLLKIQKIAECDGLAAPWEHPGFPNHNKMHTAVERVSNQPGKHDKTQSLQNKQTNKKLAMCGGTRLWSQLLRRL
ncbi:hypothetical protein AAY473_002275, partial [Plecturocebus cupreus]